MSNMRRPGQPCRRCGRPVELQARIEIPKRRRGDRHYYDYWLHCPGCKTNYYLTRAKRSYVDSDGPRVAL